MNFLALSTRVVIAVGIAALLAGVTHYPSQSEATAASHAPMPAVSGAIIMEWNQQAVALTLLPASAQAPVHQTRTMAIVQVSMHDAVNGITRAYATYLSPGVAPGDASPEAAAIAAAHHSLRNLFPTHATNLDAAYLASLAAHGLSQSDPGIAYGRAAATAVLDARANDGAAQAQYAYDAPGAGDPGVWVRLNNAPALLPGWGDVAPWVLRNPAQFRPDAPPALDSQQYADDYNEVKEIGALNSVTRTAEQTQIATFWRASPTAIWNPAIRQLVAARDLDVSDTARTFALVYLSVADASISCWNTKYLYNFWRPQPAIRRGSEDGNDGTTADPTWAPLFPTPPHPEYTSGHTVNSSAMASTLVFLFEDDPGVPISVTIGGITREWKTLSTGIDEVVDARVYSGLHFRTADEVGAEQGAHVARFVYRHALRPCRVNRLKCP